MRFLINPSKKLKLGLIIILLSMCLAVTSLVYITGGVQYAYSHTMYVPIVIGAIVFGPYGGALTGLIGGFFLGPFMPVDVASGYMQEPINWIVRISFFVLIGVVTGYIVSQLKTTLLKRIDYHSHLPDSRIPLITAYYEHVKTKSDSELKHSKLICLKILNYDNINDFLDHDNYITVLSNAYQRLRHILPKANIYSKDLQMLLVHHNDEMELKVIIQKIQKALIKPFYIKNVPIHLEIVMGASSLELDIEETMNQSLQALRYAEKYYYNYAIYESSFGEKNIDFMILGSVMNAIKNNDFYLEFQPQYNASDESIVTLEALLRWNHQTLGSIPPDEFIPMIEKTSLINPLTEWVVKRSP